MEGTVGSAGESRFVYAETPVSDVHVSVEGLHGSTRMTALAAAEVARSARTLGGLDRRLRQVAASFATVPHGEEVFIEVSPGSEKGCINVAFRPQPGLRLASEAGLEAQLDPALSLQAEQVVSADSAQPSARFGLSGLAGLGRDAIAASAKATPLRLPGLGSSVTATAELTASGANLTRPNGPRQSVQLGAVSFGDPSGTHTVRVESASRELFPSEGSSEAVLAGPLRSTKTSISYQALHDGRQDGSGLGELRRGRLELAGLLGDVALAKADCLWACSRRILGGTGSISAALGMAVPLAPDGARNTCWEDRFFLGGSLAGPSERLPGFSSCGIGPTDTRKPTNDAEVPPGQLRKVFRFSRDWQVETGLAAPAAANVDRKVPVDHIGGDARASVEAKVQWPIHAPLAGGLQLHWLIFGAAGSLVGRVRPQLFRDLAGELRASVGAGVGTPLPGGGFLGLACAQPLLYKPGDDQQRLQLWLSLGSLL